MAQEQLTNKRPGPVPVRNHLADEADLRWFFSVGQSAFERSTFGTQLELAEQFGFGADGDRIESPRKREERIWKYRQAQCRRTHLKLPPDLVEEMRGLLLKSDLLEDDPSVTAQESDEFEGEQGYEPDDAALQRYATISRALLRVSQSHHRALGLYFGLRATRWATHELGRLLMLYGETPAGRQLLDLHPQREGRPDDRIAQEWTDERASKRPERGRLLIRCREQALALLHDAQAAYAAARRS
jgi:hypothetical protein